MALEHKCRDAQVANLRGTERVVAEYYDENSRVRTQCW